MKRNVLALSIAAMIGGLGFVGSASAALTVNESGEGHMLLVPYYTAQNGNMTVMHVVNTDTTNGKAMKVRFRGASNSDDVLDFQVFMSPGDVWTAAVTAGADGVAQLVTADGTCTLPAIAKGQQIPFVTDRLPASMAADAKAAQTREGYVEIFNMADIDGTPATKSALYTAIKHVNGNAPCTASALDATLAYEDVATIPAGSGLVAPTNGLTGSWYIINVPETTTFAGAMTAIVSDAAPNNIVFSPQKNGTGALSSADPLFNAGVLAKQFYDVPDLSTPYDGADSVAAAAAQASSLSQALAASTVVNQYANDASITAKTDWVFSMPTRRYSIAANYANPVSQQAANVAGTTVTAVSGATAPYRYINTDVVSAAPAANFFTATNTSVNGAGQICVTASGQTFFDREETSKVSGAVFSPGQIGKTELCGEVSVLSFADAGASVLGASVARSNVTGAYVNGWGSVNFAAPGVPMVGASFIKLSNPNANNGTSGTYGITWPHAKK
ncbi:MULTISPECIES: cell surface protein [Diaphorobacter]|uniref:cell surface protein n=1 Tax=Diaphorobacter TaxID=238749 RepID=UPI00289DB410|nr:MULTISPECIES: cell surface protein [Diaphorobacter]